MPDNLKIRLDTDTLLMLRVRQRDDQSAFEQLYRKYAPIILMYLIKHNGNIAICQEFVQECFLRAWRSRRNFKANSSVRTYLIGIAKNLLNDHIKKQRSENRLLRVRAPADWAKTSVKSFSSSANARNSDLASEEIRDKLIDTLGLLPAHLRKAIEVYYFENLRSSAAAQKCACSKTTFYQRLSDATIRVRQLLRNSQS